MVEVVAARNTSLLQARQHRKNVATRQIVVWYRDWCVLWSATPLCCGMAVLRDICVSLRFIRTDVYLVAYDTVFVSMLATLMRRIYRFVLRRWRWFLSLIHI